MKIERIDFDKGLDSSILGAVKFNIRNKVLLEDTDKGILFGEISQMNKTTTYVLLHDGKGVILFYQNLKEIYLIKPSE